MSGSPWLPLIFVDKFALNALTYPTGKSKSNLNNHNKKSLLPVATGVTSCILRKYPLLCLYITKLSITVTAKGVQVTVILCSIVLLPTADNYEEVLLIL